MSLLAQGFDGAHDLLIRPDAKVMCPDFNQSARAGHPVLTLPGQSLNLVPTFEECGMNSPRFSTAPAWIPRGGQHTAEEIAQQPALWQELADLLEGAQARLDGFLGDWLHDPRKRVIFTGAGSSGFIAEMVADHINAQWPADVRAVHTTSLLTHPSSYLTRDRPTLLVSFGRSGSSPESVAAVDLATFSGKYSVIYRIAGDESQRDGFNLNEYLSRERAGGKQIVDDKPLEIR